MRNIYFFLILHTGLFSLSASAQQPGASTRSGAQKIEYKVLVLMTGIDSLKGSIYSTGDSSVVIAKTRTWFYPGTTPTETVPVERIWSITARRRSEIREGLLFGALVGALVGGVIGHESYKPCVSKGYFDCLLSGPGFSALGGAVIGFSAGALVGGAIGGSIKKTITIKGKRDSYAAQREKLKRLSITGQ